MSAKTKYDFVIIGGGIAGVTCVETLISIFNERKIHKSIALISAHSHLKGISKIQNVSKYLMDIEVAEYSHKQFHDKVKKQLNNECIRLSLIHGFVTNLDPSKHTIAYIQNDEPVLMQYGKCLVASGGSPKLFNVKQAKIKKNIHCLRDSETVQSFSNLIASSQCAKLMIVGNGGISLEIIYALLQIERATPMEIVWIIKHDFIGNTFFDKASAAFLMPKLFPTKDPKIGKERVQNIKECDEIYSNSDSMNNEQQINGGAVGPRWIGNLCKAAKAEPVWLNHVEMNENEQKMDQNKDKKAFANKLSLRIKCDVSSIEQSQNGKSLNVKLTNGETVCVDHLLCAMGVTPNTQFCSDSYFVKSKTREIVVNEYLESSVDGVFAAGDCCNLQMDENADNVCWFQMKLWSQSQRQGFIAAHSMSTKKEEKIENIHLLFNFELFGHFTKFFDQKCVFLGKYYLQKDEKNGINILMRVKPGEEFIKLIVKNGRAIGAVLIGETDLEETFENIILNKIDISCYGDDFLKYNVDLEAMFD